LNSKKLLLHKKLLPRLHISFLKPERDLEKSKKRLTKSKKKLKLLSSLLRLLLLPPKKLWRREWQEKRRHLRRLEQEEKELPLLLLLLPRSNMKLKCKPEETKMPLKSPSTRKCWLTRKLPSKLNSSMFGELAKLVCLSSPLISKSRKKEDRTGSLLKIPSWVSSRRP